MILSQHIKKSLSVVFLLGFILIKVAGLHGVSHEDDIEGAEDCAWCHLTGTDKNTPLITAEDNFELTPIQIQQTIDVINHYASIDSSKTPVCLIFNKPPPGYYI